MKKTAMIYSLLLALASLISCSESNNNNTRLFRADATATIAEEQNTVTIKTGIYGTTLLKEGNCMPTFGPGRKTSSGDCQSKAVQDTLVIHELTSWDDMIGNGSLYDGAKSDFIRNVISNSEGFYEVELAAGGYSIFILHNGKLFANSGTGEWIEPVFVEQDSVIEYNPTVDLAVY